MLASAVGKSVLGDSPSRNYSHKSPSRNYPHILAGTTGQSPNSASALPKIIRSNSLLKCVSYQHVESQYAQDKLLPAQILEREAKAQLKRHRKLYGNKSLIRRVYKQPEGPKTLTDLADKLQIMDHPFLNGVLTDLKQ